MKFLRDRFKTMKPYHSDYITEGIKLDANENPYPVPEEMIVHMQKWISTMQVSRYPDTDSKGLMQAIAKAYDLKPQNVICGVGSDELLDCILRATIENGDYVLAPYPSFSMYPQFTMLNAGALLQVALKEDFSYDVPGLIEKISKKQPKVIFLCHPNNPTGSVLSLEDISKIAEAAQGLVVVDEAYGEFCEISALPLINTFNNIIVLKTFSKAYALAGARVGYGLACEALIELLNTVKVPYNLNIFSQEIATWAIENKVLFEPIIENIKQQRAYLDTELKALGLTVYPSATNFIWLKMPKEAYLALEEAKVYIRKMQYEGKPYYRITVGTEDENKVLLKVLTDYFNV
ncbi:histidinol-phosphate transaminase [Cellulosilyticum sp. I15G10I2]|uniref:histidinol-phosphate transaminase n=1 Tax=Cellulosilyticum sp. I15G10I2 TaxID=1892843 RepID=UPI00085CB740|nr:histidinol-phosphate transaminase [Cellulosilyticum sp. I15G10I2]